MSDDIIIPLLVAIAVMLAGALGMTGYAASNPSEIQWASDLSHTVRHKDKYCYVFNQQIHDRPVKVRVCRELREGEK